MEKSTISTSFQMSYRSIYGDHESLVNVLFMFYDT
jgi:hypothetical protein